MLVCTEVPPEEDKDVEVSKAIEYCRPHSRSIEINYKNMDDEVMVTKVNFQFDPSVRQGGTISGG